jgi:hypothetical protein
MDTHHINKDTVEAINDINALLDLLTDSDKGLNYYRLHRLTRQVLKLHDLTINGEALAMENRTIGRKIKVLNRQLELQARNNEELRAIIASNPELKKKLEEKR